MSELDDLLMQEEDELRYFTIEYEDGTSAEVGIIAQFEIEFEELGTRQEYIVVAELVNGEFPEDNLEVMPFRYYPDPLNPDQFHLADVDSEDEQRIVQETFEEIMADEPDEDENPIYS